MVRKSPRRSSSDFDFFEKCVLALLAFVLGYFIPFFAIQLIFFGMTDPFAMYSTIRATTASAAFVNLASLFIAIAASVASILFFAKPALFGKRRRRR